MNPEELRVIRDKLGMTQEQLASALGVHRVAVARWETGTRKIPSMLALALHTLAQGHRKTLKRRATAGKEPKKHG
ncbi:MAG: helix-turn-helix domain-containing protein [Acidobacteria bacterium]|nr:helix-turn-helix domain-containing protein [Acidobacteriota bacterium]